MKPDPRRSAKPHPRHARRVGAPAMALYEQVKDFVARKIQDGSLRPGDRW